MTVSLCLNSPLRSSQEGGPLDVPPWLVPSLIPSLRGAERALSLGTMGSFGTEQIKESKSWFFFSFRLFLDFPGL